MSLSLSLSPSFTGQSPSRSRRSRCYLSNQDSLALIFSPFPQPRNTSAHDFFSVFHPLPLLLTSWPQVLCDLAGPDAIISDRPSSQSLLALSLILTRPVALHPLFSTCVEVLHGSERSSLTIRSVSDHPTSHALWLTFLQFDFVDTREFTDHGCGMRMK